MDSLLKNKVVLITGSTTGIGKAIAHRCVEEGARVLIHGLIDEKARDVSGDLGDVAGWFTADLRDPEAPEMIVDAVIDRFGRLDALVNNAAVTTRSTIDTTDPETFDRIAAINLRAPLLMIRAAMPHFRKAGGGSVLNIGSVNALGGEPSLLVYSISKGGLQTMTRNLANAHNTENIRFNQLNVGWTLTEHEHQVQLKDGMPENWYEQLPEVYAPSGRIFRPEEIAAHAVFWLSDVIGPVTGSVYEIEQYTMIGRNPDKEV